MTTQFQERFDSLPAALQQEVLQFIDYLFFKYNQGEIKPTAFKNGKQQNASKHQPSHPLSRPIRQTFNPEKVKKDQDWSGHNEDEIMNAIREIDVQEPIEELLASLSK